MKGRMDLNSFIRYLQFEKRYSLNTINAYSNDLKQFADFLNQVYELDNLLEARHTQIRSWMVKLIEENIDARSINRKLSSLKTFYKFQMKMGLLKASPMTKVTAPRIAKRLPSFINENQMDLLWRNYDFGKGFSALRDKTIFELLYATGMRRSELINLTDQSFHWHQPALKVLGKGNKERIIPLNFLLKKWLKEYSNARNKEFSTTTFEAFIVNDKGKKIEPRQFYRIVNAHLKNITTIDKKSPHVLRHTFATHLLNQGAEINAIKELLGHASLASTQVYTHNTIEKLKDVYRKAHPKA